MQRLKIIIGRSFFVLFFLFIIAAMILYDKGYYDFTFIKRPSEATASKPEENAVSGEETGKTDGTESPDFPKA